MKPPAQHSHSTDPDMRNAEKALRRAAETAKKRAEAHGVKAVIYKKDQPRSKPDS